MVINISIINLILLLTNVGVICYYLGKGKVVIRKTFTEKQFKELKDIEQKNSKLIEKQIQEINDYRDPEFID